MKTMQAKAKKQVAPWSFRPDDDVRKLIEFVEAETNLTRSQMVNLAVRCCGQRVIDEYFARHRAAAIKFDALKNQVR